MNATMTVRLDEAQMDELADMIAKKLRNAQEPDSYTVPEAATKLRVSTKTIRRRIDAKLIRTVPGIGATRIPRSEIKRLLNEPQTGGHA